MPATSTSLLSLSLPDGARSSLLSAPGLRRPSAPPARVSGSTASVESPGILFPKLCLVAALFASSVALKHPQEEAKRQVLVLWAQVATDAADLLPDVARWKTTVRVLPRGVGLRGGGLVAVGAHHGARWSWTGREPQNVGAWATRFLQMETSVPRQLVEAWLIRKGESWKHSQGQGVVPDALSN